MEQINPVYGYTTEKDGDYTKIIYNKKKIGNSALFSFTVATLIPVMIITSAITGNWHSFGSAVFLWLVLQIAAPCFILWLFNRKRTTGEISISKKNLIVDGKQYQLDHIANFAVKDRKGADQTEVYITHRGSYSSNLAGGINAVSDGLSTLSHSSGNVLRKALNEAGFRITMRYAAKEIIVANHLGEHEVAALFDKVTEVAGYNKSA